MNCQIVCCPGLNDGKELEFSLNELEKLRPAIQSIAAVPVGLTKFRNGLAKLRPYTPEEAKAVISTVDAFGKKCLEKYGTRLAFCADEFYLKAALPIPDEEYYEDYPQIENGVGLWKDLEVSFFDALESCEADRSTKSRVSLITGTAAYPLIKKLAAAAEQKFPNVKADVFEILNDFFGHSITVAGLVTGQDLIAQLKNKDYAKRLIIPSVMLRSEEDMFLDNVTKEDVQKALDVTLTVTPQSDGAELLYNILGE